MPGRRSYHIEPVTPRRFDPLAIFQSHRVDLIRGPDKRFRDSGPDQLASHTHEPYLQTVLFNRSVAIAHPYRSPRNKTCAETPFYRGKGQVKDLF